MKKIFYFLMFLSGLSVSAMAQTPLENAGYLYEDKKYVDAAAAYKGLVEKIKKPELKSEVYAKIGNCYFYAQNYTEAETWYNKALSSGNNSGQFYLNFGDVKMYNGDYANASDYFEKAKAADSSLIRLAEIRLSSTKSAAAKKEFPSILLHSNVRELNSPMGEYGIGLMDSNLVFSSTRIEDGGKTDNTTGQGFARLYLASSENSEWKLNGKLPAEVNSAYNNGTFSYHAASATAYYAQCNGFDGKSKTCKIYSTKYDVASKTWQKPEALSFNDEVSNHSHPAISADGTVLYFSSDRPNGFGKRDLYKSIKGTGNAWGTPINLGREINTPGDDMFPTVSGDSLFIYSTDGKEGLGGLDLYKATMVNGTPRNPKWMDRPFNSAGDDFNLIFGQSHLEGFYCSNRIGGFGGDDIYKFAMDPRFKTVSGYVREDKTGIPVANSKVVITGTDGSVFEVTTDNTGKFTITNANPEIAYKLLGSSTGYFSNSTMIPAINMGSGENPETQLQQRNNAQVDLVKITRGEIRLNDIYYDYNSAELTATSKSALMDLVKILWETPDINIVINSHSDEVGSSKYNLMLSEKRAQSVVQFLYANGIDASRLSSKGWGETNPVIRNAQTEDEHAENRRTTFEVTNLDLK